jgi:hypothetical protein
MECRSKVKARVQLANGSWAERIPAWIKWATQEWNEIQYNGVYYEPQVPTYAAVLQWLHAVLLYVVLKVLRSACSV